MVDGVMEHVDRQIIIYRQAAFKTQVKAILRIITKPACNATLISLVISKSTFQLRRQFSMSKIGNPRF
jgi:hypothetical protein